MVVFHSERPHFTQEPKPQEVTVGDGVALTCRIAGTSEISVAWFKGDGKLRQSPTCLMDFSDGVATLKLTQTTKFDRGEYVCKAENRVGVASASCNVMVKGDACFLLSVCGEPPHFPSVVPTSGQKGLPLTKVKLLPQD